MSDTEKLTVSSTFEELPTGKPHVSFSELRDWQDCSYRHKLKYVDKHVLQKPSPHMDFGTAVHAACEKYLATRIMDPEISVLFLNEAWKRNEASAAYTLEALPKFIDEARVILAEVPQWLESTFPGWEYIDAEHQLYDPDDPNNQQLLINKKNLPKDVKDFKDQLHQRIYQAVVDGKVADRQKLVEWLESNEIKVVRTKRPSKDL